MVASGDDHMRSRDSSRVEKEKRRSAAEVDGVHDGGGGGGAGLISTPHAAVTTKSASRLAGHIKKKKTQSKTKHKQTTVLAKR